ncbi:MAG: class I mannose-6-phosphate isomerase [Bacteroidales bacterium]|nr:class I mannose-6-phosphate isomerase [Bacteroidales bacterium]
MEDLNRKLYPLRFIENNIDMPWGQICYQIADLGFVDSMISEGWFGGNTLSELMGTYLERVVGDDSFEYYGLQFPLMVKVIKATACQPLQINVGDKIAEERYDSFGKTALWYIKEASDDASLYLGLKQDVEAGEFYQRCKDGTIREILNVVHPKAGDCFLIKPGTVFAAGPGLTIVEISECSELSFNLEMELEEAFDLIDFHHYSPASDCVDPLATVATLGHVRGGTADKVGGGVREADVEQGVNTVGRTMAECDEFKVTMLQLENPVHIFSDQPGGFAIYHCIYGEAFIQAPNESGGFENWFVKAGKSILVPSEVNDYILFAAEEGTRVLEAIVPKRSLPDSYYGDSPADENPDPHIRNWN